MEGTACIILEYMWDKDLSPVYCITSHHFIPLPTLFVRH